jgi:hypothetical protein
MEHLAAAVALDAGAVDAWAALGELRRAAGDLDGARAAFVAAAGDAATGSAAAPPVPGEEAAFALAQAARCAREAGDAAEAARLATAALARHAPFLDEQRAAVAHLVTERELDEAGERLALALAVAPEDAELLKLSSLLRARSRLTAT